MQDFVHQQNDAPFLGTLNIRCRIIIRTQKGTLILTTTHVGSAVAVAAVANWQWLRLTP